MGIYVVQTHTRTHTWREKVNGGVENISKWNESKYSFLSRLSYRCVEVVKASQYVELANDLEINKAITYLRQKDFNQVSSAAFLMLVGPSGKYRETPF